MITGDELSIFPDQQVFMDLLADRWKHNGILAIPSTTIVLGGPTFGWNIRSRWPRSRRSSRQGGLSPALPGGLDPVVGRAACRLDLGVQDLSPGCRSGGSP
ncbi:MAG: hypothetical protein R2705_23870 [Ilumatobacteraceae bacterium]